MVHDHYMDFLAIQKTKLELMEESFCGRIWSSDDYDSKFSPLVGNRGGILSIWFNFKGKCIFNFEGSRFVGVCLEWGAESKRCFIVNVYSKCTLDEKHRL